MDFGYLGREDADQELSDALEVGGVLLEGPRGVGKTAVLKHWEAHPPADSLVLRFDLQGVASATALADRMSESVHLRRNRGESVIAGWLGSWKQTDPWDDLERLLLRAPKRLIVLFDEVQLYLDRLRRSDAERARSDLMRLNQLRSHATSEFVLTGSIALDPVAAQLGVSLSSDWLRVPLRPLDEASGKALFQAVCHGLCSEEVLAEGVALAGGLPRWIKLLAQRTRGGAEQLELHHLESAVTALLASHPFSNEVAHLGRHDDPVRIQKALELSAAPGANRNSVLAGLGRSRRVAEDVLTVLEREFYLRPGTVEHQLPLFARWLSR